MGTKTRERRYFPMKDAEIRAAAGDEGSLIIEGYPIVYDRYANLWGFKEIIRKGAATEALAKSSEVVLWNHQSDQPMAARKNGTLEVSEDDHGVRIRAEVSGTVWGRNGHEAIEAGVVDKMSFAFDIEEDKWTTQSIDGVKIDVREIIAFAELYDYSPVTYPAYEDTEVEARSKELALRNRPEPGAPGEDSKALLEVMRDGASNLRAMRENLKSIEEGQ